MGYFLREISGMKTGLCFHQGGCNGGISTRDDRFNDGISEPPSLWLVPVAGLRCGRSSAQSHTYALSPRCIPDRCRVYPRWHLSSPERVLNGAGCLLPAPAASFPAPNAAAPIPTAASPSWIWSHSPRRVLRPAWRRGKPVLPRRYRQRQTCAPNSTILAFAAPASDCVNILVTKFITILNDKAEKRTVNMAANIFCSQLLNIGRKIHISDRI